MICCWYGKDYSIQYLDELCRATNEGVSMLAIANTAEFLGFKTIAKRVSCEDLTHELLPCILYWSQNHFVVLCRIKRDRFYVCDPAKGKTVYTKAEFSKYWVSDKNVISGKGIALFLQKTGKFGVRKDPCKQQNSVQIIVRYLKEYKFCLSQILCGLLLGCLLQLLMPFLTQSIVDVGIRQRDIGFIWLVLLGELMIVTGRTVTDFIRRWMLLHISMRINISLVSDFFIKLLKLPMSFFDTKLMGDLLQRVEDHSRVQNFLTGQVLNIVFTFLSFIIFGIVLFVYNKIIFGVFAVGSVIYGLWIFSFLQRRKVLDYDIFEQQAINQNKTFQLITSMQEIKLQDCEQRRRWEWEDTQVDLFRVQMKSLKLQQTQEAGSIFINEVKNILITVLAATAVINGRITFGAMLAIQYIVGQLNSPVEQFMSFVYSLQDVKISLERINEIHTVRDEDSNENRTEVFGSEKSISIENIDFKYDPHALKKTLERVSLDIPAGKVTAIVGASGSGKTTLIKLMLGYYPVMAGTISIAGRNCNHERAPTIHGLHGIASCIR